MCFFLFWIHVGAKLNEYIFNYLLNNGINVFPDVKVLQSLLHEHAMIISILC